MRTIAHIQRPCFLRCITAVAGLIFDWIPRDAEGFLRPIPIGTKVHLTAETSTFDSSLPPYNAKQDFRPCSLSVPLNYLALLVLSCWPYHLYILFKFCPHCNGTLMCAGERFACQFGTPALCAPWFTSVVFTGVHTSSKRVQRPNDNFHQLIFCKVLDCMFFSANVCQHLLKENLQLIVANNRSP